MSANGVKLVSASSPVDKIKSILSAIDSIAVRLAFCCTVLELAAMFNNLADLIRRVNSFSR